TTASTKAWRSCGPSAATTSSCASTPSMCRRRRAAWPIACGWPGPTSATSRWATCRAAMSPVRGRSVFPTCSASSKRWDGTDGSAASTRRRPTRSRRSDGRRPMESPGADIRRCGLKETNDMLSAADNDLLTRTGAGTPMGQFFRRFWQPVALSRELPEPDGAPLRVNIMGERLVAFRNSDGVVGLVNTRCPHRGADLYFGRNESCAIRCVFHGWQFDIQGRPVELPNVPPDASYHDTLRLKAYPTREYGEVVWAYMGPDPWDRDLPEVPQLEFGSLPASHRFVTKKLQECNWAQSIEGALDTSHFSFLHMPASCVRSNENPDAPAD